MEISFTDEEQAYIQDKCTRCSTCGHLLLFHPFSREWGDSQCDITHCSCRNFKYPAKARRE
mgnify:CR=1 FL=1